MQIERKFCEMYIQHPPHEWSSSRTSFYCGGRTTLLRPGDEPQAKKVYRCKRKDCNRVIKIMIFQGPDEYCSVDCQKMDAGEYPIIFGPVITVPIRKVLQSGDSLTITVPPLNIS